MQRLLTYWLPPIAWTAVILSASVDAFSAANTGGWLERIAVWMTGHPLSPSLLEWLNFVVRKCAHLIEYGILGGLAFRALRGERPSWSLGWAIGAVLLAACVASIDEIHQTFIPSRTGTWHDVLLDAAGAAVTQVLIRAAQVLPFRAS